MTYEKGIYRTQNGKFVVHSGSRWREFTSDWRIPDLNSSFADPPSSWGVLTLLTGPHLADDTETLNKVKIWWEKSAKREDADWTALIELASILMKTVPDNGQ